MSARNFVTTSGIAVTIGVEDATLLRLRDTCFRTERTPLAGNFSLWSSFFEMLNDGEFVALLLKELDRLIVNFPSDRACINQKYFSVTHLRNVGWSSTAPSRDFAPEETEPFALNNHCIGLRVKEGVKYLAPLADMVTVSANFKKFADRWSLVVHTVYPGRNIGPLRGASGETFNISAFENIVFFRFSHPGEPLA